MDPITSTRLRQISLNDWATQGFPAPAAPEETDPLDALILPAAVGTVLHLTGWERYDAVPDDKAPLVELSIRLAAEMLAAQSTPDYLETLADFDLIQSFSAGSYSESRRSPEDAAKARLLLAAWPPLAAAIRAAMTPEALEEYDALLRGEHVPAFDVTTVDWGYDSWMGLMARDPYLYYGDPWRY